MGSQNGQTATRGTSGKGLQGSLGGGQKMACRVTFRLKTPHAPANYRAGLSGFRNSSQHFERYLFRIESELDEVLVTCRREFITSGLEKQPQILPLRNAQHQDDKRL
jgi:hypothetical protein